MHSSHFIDKLNGVATNRAFGWVKEVAALKDRLLNRSRRPAYLLAMIQCWLQFVLQVVVAALATAVVALATQIRSNSIFADAFGDAYDIWPLSVISHSLIHCCRDFLLGP